eukprot:1892153-Rhodomonas_salina.1
MAGSTDLRYGATRPPEAHTPEVPSYALFVLPRFLRYCDRVCCYRAICLLCGVLYWGTVRCYGVQFTATEYGATECGVLRLGGGRGEAVAGDALVSLRSSQAQ